MWHDLTQMWHSKVVDSGIQANYLNVDPGPQQDAQWPLALVDVLRLHHLGEKWLSLPDVLSVHDGQICDKTDIVTSIILNKVIFYISGTAFNIIYPNQQLLSVSRQ